MNISNPDLLRALHFLKLQRTTMLLLMVICWGGAYILVGTAQAADEVAGQATGAVVNNTSGEQLQNLSNQVPAISIVVDSGREGWEHAIPYARDPSGDNGGIDRIDWNTITIAHDCDDLYVRYVLDEGPPFIPDGFRYNILVDVDNNPMTGYRGPDQWVSIGADVLIQGGQGKVTTFKFTGGAAQDAWGWQQINFYPVSDDALAEGGRDIEYRISIQDLDVFGTGLTSFDWVAWADHSTGIMDFYPDGGNLGDDGHFNRYTFNYAPMTTAFANPERGFFAASQAYSSKYEPVNLATLQCYRQNEGISLIHRYFYLENFVKSDISQQYLDMIQADFDKIRQAGLKVIPRFAYSESSGPNLTPPYGDASKERILSHLNQLADVLGNNSDVIAAMEAGFIGLWGEWWYSDHFQPDADWDKRGEVVSGILDALPPTRMVQLRTPRYKQNIFNETKPVDQATAHNNSDLARTGHHNDCFVSSMSDGGTYLNSSAEYPYLEQETKWVAMGGETCDYHFLTDPDPNRLQCESVLSELARFHWSFLNLDWYKPTLRKWVDDNCYTEIEERLGYRFKFLQGSYDDQIKPGGPFQFSLQLINEGFSAPFNPRDAELILRHADGSKYAFKLSHDARFWLPGTVQTITDEIIIPENFPVGDYELLLNLPDPEPELRQRPEYSIRLANQNIWEAETGFNRLQHTVTIEPPIYYPNAIEILSGNYDWGTLASFTMSDADTYDIKALNITDGRATDWYASTNILALSPNEVTELTVTYGGQYSVKNVRQDVYLYNYQKERWDLIDTRSVGNTDDVMVQVTLSVPQDYLSSDGETRIRVRGFREKGKPFFCWANYLSWEIQ